MHTASLLCLMAAAWATGVAHAKLSVSDIMKQTHDSRYERKCNMLTKLTETAATSFPTDTSLSLIPPLL